MKLKAISKVNSDGVDYLEDESFNCTDKQGAVLIACGAAQEMKTRARAQASCESEAEQGETEQGESGAVHGEK